MLGEEESEIVAASIGSADGSFKHLSKRPGLDEIPSGSRLNLIIKELLHTLTNWREELLNYLDYRITNGFVEGKNNRIKIIKRMAYPSREEAQHG